MFLFQKAKDFTSTVAQKSKNLIENLSNDFQEVLNTQNQLIENSQNETFKEKSALLPWEGLKAIKSNTNGNMTQVVKEDILELSLFEEFFLIDEENYMYPFPFALEDYKYQALKVLSADPNLELMRSKLVPKKIKDDKFWKNYFYNVEVIKMKYNMANKINQTEKNEQVAVNISSLVANQHQEEEEEETKDQTNVDLEHGKHDSKYHGDEDEQAHIHYDEDDFNSSVRTKKKRQGDLEQTYDDQNKQADDQDIGGIDLREGQKDASTRNLFVEMSNLGQL